MSVRWSANCSTQDVWIVHVLNVNQMPWEPGDVMNLATFNLCAPEAFSKDSVQSSALCVVEVVREGQLVLACIFELDGQCVALNLPLPMDGRPAILHVFSSSEASSILEPKRL